VTKPANVTYTTGFSGDDSWVVITARAVYLLTDSRYTEQAHNECRCCRIIRRVEPMAAAAAKLLKRLKSVQAVSVEASTSLAAFRELKKNVKAHLKTAADIIEPLRETKNSSEVSAIRAAAQIANKALRQVQRYIKTGTTENEMAGRLDFQIRKLGGRSSFETIVAFGANASRPHHQPSSKKLKRNDTILIDFGVRYENYCCDLTRCFVIGKPTVFYKKVHKAVQEAQAAAIRTVKAGVEIKQVDMAARNVISRYNLPVYGHRTGHGLGLEVHEQPVVSKESRRRLQAGMVFTVEPGVYVPGKLGVRIEDDILVTQTGCEILSSDSSSSESIRT
jgi:Xaa-Pro aminopeptidase